MGLIPVGETRDSSGGVLTHFAAEPPYKYGRFTLLLLTAGGSFLVLGGLGQGNVDGIALAMLGLPLLSLGALLWQKTRFARVVYGLTPGLRALAKTVFLSGRVLAYCSVAGVLIGFTADKWIRNQI